MIEFICAVCKKRLANKIYCDELGHWHTMCSVCLGGKDE